MPVQSSALDPSLTTSKSAPPSVTTLIRRNARRHGERIAFAFEGREITYAQLDRQVALAAGALATEGIVTGDRIAFVGKNIDRYFVLLFAAAQIGAVMVPIGWRSAPGEVRYILEDTGASLLFTDGDWYDKGNAVASTTPVRRVIAVEPSMGSGIDSFVDWLDRASAPPAPIDDAERPFVQLYTSGTTGKPKGVMLNARNLFKIRQDCAVADVDWDRWGDDEVALIAMPVAHIGGTGYGLMTLYHGATGLIKREFSPEIALGAIRDERVSKLFIVPTALQIMIRHPEARQVDYRRINHILYGASPMPLALLREAMDVIGAGLVQQYGMTETAGTIVALGADDHDPQGNDRMRSAGRALPGVEIRIVGEDRQPLCPGTVGEILVRSSANMVGYWKLPDATAQTIDSEGWLHTGDAGHLDADGYLYICDRIKDMICSGGENVYPAEVEAVLCEHAAVGEAAVIGVPDVKWGEAVKAVVVPRAGHLIDPDELLRHCRARLAGFKLPKSIDVVEDLPRNATGKVQKKTLRAPYWEGRDRQVN